MAIDGEGFFRVLQPDGTFAYTRNGEFKVDRERQLVTNKGLYAFPQITFPENFIPESVAISPQGEVSCKVPGQEEAAVIGQVQLYRFVNPAGLNALGDNLFKQTAASGEAIAGLPGMEGMGQIHHKFIEASNVSVANEMVNMIVAQRAYELNSKAIQTSDAMLGIANNLRR